MRETASSGPDGVSKRLPQAIASVLITERRRENLMIADALRRRVRNGPAAAFFHHGLAVCKGVATGAAIVIPAVLWSTGAFTGRGEEMARPAVLRPAGFVGGAGLVSPAAIEPIQKMAVSDRSDDQRRRLLDQSLARAHGLLVAQMVGEARQVLSEIQVQATPEGAFALAETYDPNVLAAHDIKGINAEVDHARRLYTIALIGGIEAARQRLAALQ